MLLLRTSLILCYHEYVRCITTYCQHSLTLHRTGAKCLSASQVPRCRGLVLHDCHAEILAIRAFNYWLLNECSGVLARERNLDSYSNETQSPAAKRNINGEATASPFVRRRRLNTELPSLSSPSWPPFELQPDIKIYMYCTCAPCGDASMELCMAAQEDATPWEITRKAPSSGGSDTDASEQAGSSSSSAVPILLDGRAHFSLLGVVRRKPARADAESTRSKSCSDKLALRQVSSLLSYETSLLVAPTENAYLEGLILPEAEISRGACERSFGGTGRMKGLEGRFWPQQSQVDDGEERKITGYRFRPFKVLSVLTEQVETLWPFGKPKSDTIPVVSPSPQTSVVHVHALQGPPPSNNKPAVKKSRPGNASAIWVLAPSFSSTLPCDKDKGAKSLPTLCKSKTGLYETIINGVKQGSRATVPSAKGASSLSRAKLWGVFRDVVQSFSSSSISLDELKFNRGNGADTLRERGQHGELLRLVEAPTYKDFKRTSGISIDSVSIRQQAIEDARDILKGWVPNAGDEHWGLDVLIDHKKRHG